MKYNLINIKMAPSRNGYSFIGTLTMGGTPVCTMHDIGEGSQPTFEVLDQKLFSLWESELEKLPTVEIYGFDMPVDKSMFIDGLHYELEMKTVLK